ncbi:glycerophosphodiester phosphodiesterase family protein [Gephyromycinifex aptenodytis]|uniref:glycerophosphodiester phosphodiesterase family protein n=1 Tax=Gephyromycinifex aptenodytis TaxID=2716227 RepID=UPI0014484DB9|nr:glycerophosphodiester phosphodiesterase family protein [Gephyromycinifex aptenodytis]
MGYVEEPGPIALAHRGGGGLAPENTLAAFAASHALGFRYLESDLRVTADGELICFHDATLDRVTQGRGPVHQYRMAQLRSLRVQGCEPIATLQEALEAFPHTYFCVDLKDERAIAPLISALRCPGVAQRLCVAGAWDGWLADVRTQVPTVATSLGWQSLSVLLACARAGVRPPRSVATGEFAHVPVKLGSVPIFAERIVQMAHDLGIRIVTWTVDEAERMHQLLDAGVDAVISDRPDVLREVMLERGQWQSMGSARSRPSPESRPAALGAPASALPAS